MQLTELANQLDFEIQRLLGECNVWEGTVTYEFLLSGDWPSLPQYLHHQGDLAWREVHTVVLQVVPGGTSVLGTDTVAVSMPAVVYRAVIGPGCGGDEYSEFTILAQPATGTVLLTLAGSYTDGTFAIPTVDYDAGNSAIALKHKEFTQNWDDSSGSCVGVVPVDLEVDVVPAYGSMFLGGLSGSPPPPDLATMLNTGTVTTLEDGRQVQGSAVVTIDQPAMEPVLGAIVRWNFREQAPPAP